MTDPDGNQTEDKVEALRAERSLNPHPETVTDELFAAGEFFDPRDLVQVRYEMLRRVASEGEAVSRAAAAFGVSRPTFYAARAALAKDGLAGLVPARSGPRSAHKLSERILDYCRQRIGADPALSSAELAELIAERFAVTVHPRSVERALARSKSGGSR